MRVTTRSTARSFTGAARAPQPLPAGNRRYSAKVYRREVHVRAERVHHEFKDELGDLAAKIEELAKSVDEGLQVMSPHR
jgi:hypothetical protein